MKKKVLQLIFFALVSATGHAQDYGNEWVDYNKQYFKIPVAVEGIYRISHTDLVSAGFPVNSVDPRRLQLFHRGEEQAIYVQGQGDAVFNTADFIEFYGRPNDGASDEELYQPAEAQPHQLYNIYSDSTAYFLTYNLSPMDGKRMTSFSENNIDGLSAEEAHQEVITLINTDQYSGGMSFNTLDVTKYSYFDYGEGWTGKQIQEGQSIDYTLSGVVSSVQSAGDPSVEVLLVGRDDVTHQAEIFIGPNLSSLRSLGTVQFDMYDTYQFESTLNWSDISGAGEVMVRISAQGIDGDNDRLSTSYIRLTYPQAVDMESGNSKKLRLANRVNNKAYIEIQNVPASPQIYDITDPSNIIRIGHSDSGTSINAMINNTTMDRELWINGDDFITPVLKRAKFQNITAADYDYIIISHPLLMAPSEGVDDAVAAYAEYRASGAGGGFDVLTLDMEMLYNQFNYGQVGPLAIYRLMRFLVNNGNPKYLFLIGKGLDPSINFHRNTTGHIPFTKFGIPYQIRDLVPSAGHPASDIAFTAGLNGSTYEPAVPVGRLPAMNPHHVMAYLNKVKETEALPFESLWRKRLLHLSGGISTHELSVFRGYTDGFAEIAKAEFLGGKVKTISKETNNTTELINVAEEVNNGLNLITFFGHSAPSVTDIDIGYATDPVMGYDNAGRYPMFLVNGCNAGQFFAANMLFGEDWILAKDKGAVGFIAHSSYGFALNLRKYSTTFYSTGYGDSVYVSKGIGDIHKETAKKYMATAAPTASNITQVQQMVLLGDPALHLFGPENPDYEINENNIYLEPLSDEPISAQVDSFAVKAIVNNFGRTLSDSIRVQVTRTLSDNSTVAYDSIFPTVYHQDTLTMIIKNEGVNGFGNNRFLVELDYPGEIDELNENNNSATHTAFIPLLGTRNLYPRNFSIVSSQPVELLVQATDILSEERDFIIEIDTIKTFDSPFKKQNTINAKLLASWPVDLLPDTQANDSTVYFWRSKFAQSSDNENDVWVTSSFIYIKDGPEGWSQSKFSQLDDNVLDGLQRDSVNREMKFFETETDLYIKTYGANNAANNRDVLVRLNGAEYNISSVCRSNTINLIAFNKSTAVPYAAIPLSLSDKKSCGRTPQVINSFNSSELETGGNDLLRYIDNVGEGDAVVLFNIGNPQFSSWSATVKAKLEEIGVSAANIDALQDGEPYILLGKKGNSPGSAREVKTTLTPADEQQIELDEIITGIFTSGSMTSGRIGPVSQWQSLLTGINISETPQTDVFGVDVIGITGEGNEQVLLSDQAAAMVDISGINAEQYPFMRLKLHVEDEDNLTPAQLHKWQVLFTGVPEGILLIGDDARQSKERQEGEPVEASFGFKNVSALTFLDSIVVEYTLFNQNNRTSETKSFKIKSPEPQDTTRFKTDLKTLGRVGVNDLNVFVNPGIQSEIYLENNIFDQKGYLTVKKDDINPIIDVAFDGIYILDGDIVSPRPVVSIHMKDENKFIFKQDTSGVNLFLKHPCETCDFERVALSSEQVQWFPADEENDFRIEYQPNKLEDGLYTLKVEATDASNNASGSEPYRVNFEVVNESSVTNFYPYPNPFSSNTRFIFTLTGSEVPDEIKIQIMTVSGKIVKEITQNELGPVRIGNNISDFAWNGKDEFGDQLANGVYLYKVIVRQNGQKIDHRNTSADKAFKNGFGKLYLLR